MPKHRIFLAIRIPEEIKDVAESYLKPFMGDKNIRIPKKEGWHITVSFCGYLTDQEAEELQKITEKAAFEINSFEISPEKIIWAPPDRPKRMIWLTFKKSEEFADLKNKIEKAIVAGQSGGLFRSFRKENREPNPHLTLARFREDHFFQIKNLFPEEGVSLQDKARPFLVTEIEIMESQLTRQGAEYSPLFKIKLK
jgi:2'-5' RNA ligase